MGKPLLSRLTARPVVCILVLTLLFEGVACTLRFGFGLRTSEDTAWCAQYTGGIRVHHGYPGVVLIALAFVAFPKGSVWRRGVACLGAALVLSDVMHHFLVLWPLTGSPQFDLLYPG
ncbi:MAG: hypothetical protein PVJ27_06410 [Candidatus Brocadiaceae bacterium]|jgi:hypothetical protein